MIAPEIFQGLCRRNFQYLIDDFACTYHVTKDPDYFSDQFRGYDQRFTNKTTEVSVTLDFEQGLPVIHLRRLEEVADIGNVYEFGLLVLIRCPELDPLKNLLRLVMEDKIKNGRWSFKPAILLLNKTVEELIEEYSQLLNFCAKDVLTGDFSVFPALDAKRECLMDERDRRNEPTRQP